MGNKKGLVSILFVVIVLAISSAIVFFVIRNYQKTRAAEIFPTPGGTIHVYPYSTTNNGSITITATDVHGANGAQVDNVRYYLLNPALKPGNDWGDPDWCSIGSPCKTSFYTGGGVYSVESSASFTAVNSTTYPPGNYGTYDISQSSDPTSNYQITWDKNTHSSGSTSYSRALTATNIPTGTYIIGIRVEDVDGNVNGGASQVPVIITDGTAPNPSPTSTPSPSPSPAPTPVVTSCSVDPAILTPDSYGYAPATFLTVNSSQDNTPFNISVKLMNSSNNTVRVNYGTYSIVSPYTHSYITSSVGQYYFTVNDVRCQPDVQVKSRDSLLGLSFSTTYFGLMMAPGGVGKKAFDLTSNGATKFVLNPPAGIVGIRFAPTQGNIKPGETLPIYVYADKNQQYGIYTGKVYAGTDLSSATLDTGVSGSITIQPGIADSDNDGFTNAAENVMGTDPNYSCKTPSGLSAWPPEINGDGVVTLADALLVFNAYSAKTYIPRYDMDGNGVITVQDAQKVYSYNNKTCQSTVADNDHDGFSNDVEAYVGTDPNKACSMPGNVAAWPADINNDGGVGITTDLVQLLQHSGVNAFSSLYSRRYDLDANGVINDADQTILRYYAGKTCTPGT